MRHGKKFNHLGRKTAHRKAMLANMACSLIEHKRIFTTLAKGKALRVYVEPLMTKSKTDTTHSRRNVFSYLKNKHAVNELFSNISTKIADRPGGYTRVLKTGHRKGDGAQMCMIELVDYNEIYTKEEKKKSTRRRRKKTKNTTSSSEEKIVETESKQNVAESSAKETQEKVDGQKEQ